VFGEKVVSRGLWAFHSPDIVQCDFFLLRYLKDEVYQNSPHMKELRENIQLEVFFYIQRTIML
jgi:hypothetical protein